MMSQRSYARHRAALGLPGGTLRAVQVAIADGRVPVTKGGKIRDAEEADAAWLATTKEDRVPITGPTAPARKPVEPEPGPGSSTGHSPVDAAPPVNELAAARVRHERARAETAEHELRRMQGELVPLAEVRAEVTARYTVVRTKLLGIPARVRQRAPHLDAAAVRLLEDFIREALEELAVPAG